MNPYLVLDVSLNADDQTIRQAYLKAVKGSPPEAAPERFQAVRQAYEKIKDQVGRHRYVLLDEDCPGRSPLDALARYASHRRPFDPLPFAAMKEFLVAVAKPGAK